MIISSSEQMSDICVSTYLVPVSWPLSCARKHKQATAHWPLLSFQVKSKRLSSSDFTSYSTAIAVKFLVSLQRGHWTGHASYITTGNLPADSFLHLVLPDFGFVCNLDFSFGAGLVKTFLTTSCFVGSHRFAIHTPGRELYIWI